MNEKDLTKISVGQKAKLTSVSNNVVVDGSISYIDDNPPEGNSDAASGNPGGARRCLVIASKLRWPI